MVTVQKLEIEAVMTTILINTGCIIQSRMSWDNNNMLHYFWVKKAETREYLQGWQDAMEDITWEAENYLPGADPETGIPNGSVRTYGYWSGTNTASGKTFRGLWYHYLTFNEEGKIINGGDFGDATGLVMSVMPDQE